MGTVRAPGDSVLSWSFPHRAQRVKAVVLVSLASPGSLGSVPATSGRPLHPCVALGPSCSRTLFVLLFPHRTPVMSGDHCYHGVPESLGLPQVFPQVSLITGPVPGTIRFNVYSRSSSGLHSEAKGEASRQTCPAPTPKTHNKGSTLLCSRDLRSLYNKGELRNGGIRQLGCWLSGEVPARQA